MKRYTKWLSVSLALIMLLTLLPGCGKNPTGNGEQIGTDPRLNRVAFRQVTDRIQRCIVNSH